MMKYEPLRAFLHGRADEEIRLTFEDVERILGASLPRSAYEHQAWWANNPEGHSHCRAWHEAGWKTTKLNLARRTVTFSRSGEGTAAPTRPPDPWGALAGTVMIIDEAALTAPGRESWDAESGPA